MNKDLMIKGFIFVAGAAIGSVVTWKMVKTKYEQIAQEEIESVKEAFSNKDITVEDVAKAAVKEGFNVDVSVENREYSAAERVDPESPSVPYEIRDIVKKLGYVSELNEKEKPDEPNEENKEEEEEDMDSKPYVISPDEFGDCEYITVSLSYYLDGIVTNEQGKIVTNIDELIGEDFADHFGEYEDDSVFVRNDRLGMDFEILKDYRDYYEDEE